MSGAPSRFPLAWPAGKARTPPGQRKPGQFGVVDDSRGYRKSHPISIAAAFQRVDDEVSRLGGRYPVLSSNLELRLDGVPRADRAAPDDPGVCLYFDLAGKPYAMACDTYASVAQNIAAIAGHIEATRRIERYGVASAAETLQAFQALPAPKQPHEVLGVPVAAGAAEIRAAWKRLVHQHHPDRGGSEARTAELNAARDAMLKGLG